MIKKAYKIVDPNGFHARPATMVANAAEKQKCTIILEYDGFDVSMKSLMGLMALGMPYGAHFTVTFEGEGEEASMRIIEDLLIAQKVVAANKE